MYIVWHSIVMNCEKSISRHFSYETDVEIEWESSPCRQWYTYAYKPQRLWVEEGCRPLGASLPWASYRVTCAGYNVTYIWPGHFRLTLRASLLHTVLLHTKHIFCGSYVVGKTPILLHLVFCATHLCCEKLVHIQISMW